MNQSIRVLFAGGGTGGHIYPLVAVAGEIEKFSKENQIPIEFHFFGSRDRYSSELEEAGIHIHSIMTGKLRRYFSLMNLVDIPKFFIGCIQAWFKMFFLMPDVILSKGGPGALPVVWAGWFYRIPIVIHESDARPGLSTLFSAPFAKKIAVSFEGALKYFSPRKTVLTGNPVRRELLDKKLEKRAAKEALGFNQDHALMLVTGGSQGALKLDEFLTLNLKFLTPLVQIFLQTGPAHLLEVEKLSQATLLDVPVKTELEHRFRAVAYLNAEEMALALSAADIVLGRAGSSTISEAAVFGRPAILIPLEEAANDHQRLNAYEAEGAGAAVVIEEPNLNIQILVHELKRILENENTYRSMSEAALRFSRPNAGESIGQEMINLVSL